MKKIALVTGPTGSIGPVLIQTLLEHRYRVRAYVRRALSLDCQNEDIEVFQGDIADRSALNAALQGVDVVFHLAAKLHINDPDPALEDEYYRVNVEGTRCLMDAARAQDVRRVVYFSTISVYGPSRPGVIYDESSPPHPRTLYERTKYQAEQIALNAKRKKNDTPLAVVLRLAAVYGGCMKGNYLHMLKAIRQGWFVPVGPGGNRRTLVYDKDVALAALLAAEHPSAAGQIYNITDGSFYPLKEIQRTIYQLLDKSRPRYYLPVALLRFLFYGLQKLTQITAIRFPLKPDLLDKLIEDMAVNGEKAQTELGFRPRYHLKDGWRETLLTLNLIE